MSGTSMATPHVTGAAALWAAYHPSDTAAQIKDALLSNAVPLPSLSGKVLTGGRLSVAKF
jgi:subtilisin family serine protease